MFAIHRLCSTCKLRRHTSCHFINWQNWAFSNSFFSRVREDTNILLIASYSPHIGQCFKPVLKLVQRIQIFQRFPFLPLCGLSFSKAIGPLQDPVTWYGINYAGTQMTQWDFQNKGKSGWIGTSSFV